MKKRRSLFLFAVIILFGWLLWANEAVQRNDIAVVIDALPDGFSGYKIAHISDLHSARFYMDVIALLQQAKPDMICITGDLMDHRDTSCDVALSFAREATQIAPCYYITGNHEAALPQELYESLLTGLQEAGVCVLMDEAIEITSQDDAITLVGHSWGDCYAIADIPKGEGVNVLLSHLPEDLHLYAAMGYDLVLSGHAHGGQIRLPFIGGLYAPGQGIFPKYDSGLYRYDDCQMVVSRGIGNSSFPLRVNNRPEVIILTLTPGN